MLRGSRTLLACAFTYIKSNAKVMLAINCLIVRVSAVELTRTMLAAPKTLARLS
jgi:hypothetical protein